MSAAHKSVTMSLNYFVFLNVCVFFFFPLSLKETCERGLVNSPGVNAKAFVTKRTNVDTLENHSSTYIFLKTLYIPIYT